MKIPENIQSARQEDQVQWLTQNFEYFTWNTRDSQELHLAKFFGQTMEGQWINLSVLNSGKEFTKAVIKAITQKTNHK